MNQQQSRDNQRFFPRVPYASELVVVHARVARDDSRCLGFEYHEPQSIPPTPA